EADAEAVTDALRARASTVAGFAMDVKQFLNERIEETLEGAGAVLVVRLRGHDLAALEQAARDLAARLAAVPGAVDVHAAGALAAPGLRIRPRREDLLRLGVPAATVERAMRSAFGGLPVARLSTGERQTDVVLRTDTPGEPGRLARLPVATAGKQMVSLGTVADIE